MVSPRYHATQTFPKTPRKLDHERSKKNCRRLSTMIRFEIHLEGHYFVTLVSTEPDEPLSSLTTLTGVARKCGKILTSRGNTGTKVLSTSSGNTGRRSKTTEVLWTQYPLEGVQLCRGRRL